MKINYTNDQGQRVTWEKFQEETKEKSLCGACGQYYDEAFDYEGTISFTTNKKLTQEQIAQLTDIIALQIIEPVDEEQEDEDFSTRNVEVTVKEVK